MAAVGARRHRPRSSNAGTRSGSASRLPPEARIAVGIERFDYTKGILDRMRAIDELADAAAVVEGPARLHPGRRADAQQARRLQRAAERGGAAGRRNQRPARQRRLQAHRARHPPPRARRGVRAVPGGRRVHRLEPARRHEPGRQGIRRLARRRAGRADPVDLRRRLARAFGSADRQPLRHARHGRRRSSTRWSCPPASSASACA